MSWWEPSLRYYSECNNTHNTCVLPSLTPSPSHTQHHCSSYRPEVIDLSQDKLPCEVHAYWTIFIRLFPESDEDCKLAVKRYVVYQFVSWKFGGLVAWCDLMTSEFSLPITSLYISIYIQGGRGTYGTFELWNCAWIPLHKSNFYMYIDALHWYIHY